MMPTVRVLPLLAASLAVASASGQGLSLDQQGGAIGGTTTLRVAGNPSEFYCILFDWLEQTTQVPALGLTLAIREIYAGTSFALPGFSGLTNGQGTASASVGIPNDPALASIVLSLQAISIGAANQASNLVRLTPQLPGTFAPVLNQPAIPIQGGGALAQANGEFLFVGGSGPAAQVYRSRTEDWVAAGTTFGVGILSQTTTLADGRVLFTGGLDVTTGQPTDAAAVYDPATQQTTTLTMARARAGHGASLLPNGRVLISGGSNTFDLNNPLSLFTGILNGCEFFDPTTNSFVAGPNMLEPRAFHSSTTLTNGNVLVAGGISVIPFVNIPTVSATAYRFNPSNNSWGLPSTFAGGRMFHSAVALDGGRVLLVGGITLDLSQFLLTLNLQDLIVGTRTDCQLYTLGSFGFGTFATVNGMQQGRAGAALAALPGGRALIAGGFELAIDFTTNTFRFDATDSADLFSQGPNTIVPTGSMSAPRLFPSTLNLPDGNVMVLGGGAIAEIYQR